MTVRWSRCIAALMLTLAAGGCGTPKEKTAPCKRPANLSSYAPEERTDCGPMHPVNGDPAAALRAIETFQKK
jgi:hypothetical protein